MIDVLKPTMLILKLNKRSMNGVRKNMAVSPFEKLVQRIHDNIRAANLCRGAVSLIIWLDRQEWFELMTDREFGNQYLIFYPNLSSIRAFEYFGVTVRRGF